MAELITLFSDPQVWAAALALITLEVVLGVDNLIFIAVLTGDLPEKDRPKAQRTGILFAVGLRLLLLLAASTIIKLVEPVFALMGHDFSWRDILLLAGGFFLIYKATSEIHDHIDHEPKTAEQPGATEASFLSVVFQIILLDAVFSFDSVMTAVGMTPHLPIMVLAILISAVVMLVLASPLTAFVGEHPTVIILALGFLLLIGFTLIADGLGTHIPKGYIYSAMAFAAFVETLQILRRRPQKKA